MVTACLQNVSAHANFTKSSPNICHLLGQGHNLQKIIGPLSYSMPVVQLVSNIS